MSFLTAHGLVALSGMAMLPEGFTRFPWYRRWFGLRAERWVAKYLRRHGFRILGRNVQDSLGELDLVAIDGDTIVIIEVRSSETRTTHDIAATVNHDKQRRLTDAAVRFVRWRRLTNVTVRFDVVAIRWPNDQREPEVLHVRQAFQAIGRFQFHH